MVSGGILQLVAGTIDQRNRVREGSLTRGDALEKCICFSYLTESAMMPPAHGGEKIFVLANFTCSGTCRFLG